MKWFHAIGICGKATSNVAFMFKRAGWFVTGSDAQFFPPASTAIEKEGIPTVEGYSYEHLTKEFWLDKLRIKNDELRIGDVPDLCLVVDTATAKNKELLFAKKRGVDVRPFSQILGEYLVKPESIVVVGTAGKTTTTALLVKILQDLELDPCYMIGAEVVDIKDSLVNTDSSWSVLEGDEYYGKEVSRGAKFLEFKPKYLVITKIGWEHQDVYPSQEDYSNEFKKAVELIPEDGLIIAKYGDENIDEVVKDAKCKVIRYAHRSWKLEAGSKEASSFKLQASLWTVEKSEAGYTIYDDKGNSILEFNTKLIGEYNVENILAAVATILNVPARFLPIELVNNGTRNLKTISDTIGRFNGVKKRLEFLYKSDNLIIVDDFGVAPDRAKNSLTTLKENFSKFKIIGVFEANSGSRPSDIKLFKKMYKDVFKNADEIIIPDLSTSNPELVQSEEMVRRLKDLKVNATYVDSESLVIELQGIINYLRQGEDKVLIVFFSSYRLTEKAEKLTKDIRH